MRKYFLVVVIGLFHLVSHAQDTTRLLLLFVGDIMQHDSNIAAAFDATTKKYDYSKCFEYVAPILRSADLTIGNLELTLAGAPYKGYPQFSAPDELAHELKRVGFDVLVTANNHSVDRGKKGIERTLKVLDSIQLIHTGTFKDSAARAATFPLMVERSGFRLSLLNYTYGTNGIPVPRKGMVNLIDTVQMKLDLQKAREQKTDAIIVFMHWGDEYQSLPNKTQKRLTDFCFREGAKIVIGAHPHVLQPMEWRKEKDQFVVYSLGNFLSGQRPRYRDGGAMVWLELQKISSDSASYTSIHNTQYELEWVQKSNDARKDFVIMPFRYFENDTISFGDKTLHEAFNVFKKDSRELYAKHNVNISERMLHSQSDSLRYSICLGSFPEQTGNLLVDTNELASLGLLKIPHDEVTYLWYAGEFASIAEAKKALVELQARTQLKNLHVVKRVDQLIAGD